MAKAESIKITERGEIIFEIGLSEFTWVNDDRIIMKDERNNYNVRLGRDHFVLIKQEKS